MDKELTDINDVKYHRAKVLAYNDGPTLGDILYFSLENNKNNLYRHCNLVNFKMKQS